MTHNALFTPTTVGRTSVQNRVALAPMTRVSATENGQPTHQMGEYYGVFADGGFGLIVSEGLYIDQKSSQGYLHQPGIATAEHIAAWSRIVGRVHEAGAKMFAQLQHAGAQAQSNPYTDISLGPSTVRASGEQMSMYSGSGPYRIPVALSVGDIADIRRSFVTAAENARDAGFDGVELHGANGYLLDNFLTDYLNTRTDQYGGSAANRVRLLAEVSEDVVAAVGDDISVGIRISQAKVSDYSHKWKGGEDEAETIFTTLRDAGLDFIHTTEYRALAPAFEGSRETLARLAKQHSGIAVLANGNLDAPDDAGCIIESGAADLVTLGKSALANRNWPQMVARGQTLADNVPSDVLGPVATIKQWETSKPRLPGATATASECA